MGNRHDIPELLALFDLFVLPSLSEGIPMALLEAMAAGCPVVASDVGNIGEILSGEAGLLVPAGEIDELAKAITRVLSDEKTMNAFAVKGLERVAEKYSSPVMCQQYHTIFRELINKKNYKAEYANATI